MKERTFTMTTNYCSSGTVELQQLQISQLRSVEGGFVALQPMPSRDVGGCGTMILWDRMMDKMFPNRR